MKNVLIVLLLLLLINCNQPKKESASVPVKDTMAKSDIPVKTVTEEVPAANSATEAEASDEDDSEAEANPRYPGMQILWKYKFYGFSPDLKYAAFQTNGSNDSYGLNDEIGLFIVDVDKNDYARKPFKYATEGEEMPLAENDAKIQNILKEYHVIDGDKSTKFTPGASNKIFSISINKRPYALKLLQTDVGSNMIFELQLINSTDHKVLVLQKDKKLPASRGAVKRYRIKDSFVQNNKIAVMLEYDLESEQDAESYYSYVTRYMIITANVSI
jgi:predicted secreted protein